MKIGRSIYLLAIAYLKIKVKIECKIAKIFNKIKIISSKSAFGITVNHNLQGLSLCKERVFSLIGPLISIESLNQNSSFVVIGCRNSWDIDLLNMFNFKNVIGADLISYNQKKVMLADMHNLKKTFPSKKFNCIVVGWTLSYSHKPQIAAESILKISHPGSIIAISVEYVSQDVFDLGENDYNIHDPNLLDRRINSTSQLKQLFGERIEHVYFEHDAPLKKSHNPPIYINKPSSVILIFSVK